MTEVQEEGAVVSQNGNDLMLWCPGCERVHTVPISGSTAWVWNYGLVKPTLHPSIAVLASPIQPRCHSFVHKGVWQFLSDCDHHLAGKNVPMIPVKEWNK